MGGIHLIMAHDQMMVKFLASVSAKFLLKNLFIGVFAKNKLFIRKSADFLASTNFKEYARLTRSTFDSPIKATLDFR